MRVNRHNASPAGLTIFSHVPVQFPKLCAKCGKPTDKTISIKATAGKPGLKPTILLGHAGSIIEAFQELRSGSVSIPCCPTCFRAFATGRKITIACLLCAPLLLFLIVKFSSSWPEWLMVLAGFICFTMFLGAFVPYLAGQVSAMPVSVWRTSDGYFYHFSSGIFESWAVAHGVQFKELPSQVRQQ